MISQSRQGGVNILHHSNDILVIQKPWNMPVDGPKEVTVEKWVEANVLRDSDKSVKLVHQIDAATSGVLCVALTKDRARLLSHFFETRNVYKEYTALVHGHLPFSVDAPVDEVCHHLDTPIDHYRGEKPLGLPLKITLPIGQDESDEYCFRMKAFGKDALAAETEILSAECAYMNASDISENFGHYNGIQYMGVFNKCQYSYREIADVVPVNEKIPVTKLSIRLHTGRQHQIRVHMAQGLKQPIVNDLTYGPVSSLMEEPTPRMMLHAGKLCFPIDLDDSQSFPRKLQRRHALRKFRQREKLGLSTSFTEESDGRYLTRFHCDDGFPELCSHDY